MNNCVTFGSEQTFLPVLYGGVFCVGLPVNCLALYGLYRLVKADYALPVYVIHLLIGDLLQILTMPLWIDYYRRGHSWQFGDAVCRLASYAFGTSLYTSITFMSCIALERYLAIVHPLRFQDLPKLKIAHLLCLTFWVVAIVIQALGYHYGFESTQGGLCLENYPKKREFLKFQLIVMPFTFLLPVVLFGFLSLRIQRSLRRDPFMTAEKKQRIISLLVVVLLLYVLIYGPYHVTSYVLCLGMLQARHSCEYEDRVFLCLRITLGILSLNPVLDPVIYIFLRHDVRETMDSFPLLRRLLSLTSTSGKATGDQEPDASTHLGSDIQLGE
ncbi:G-protein coupled receptor 4-like [Lepisosteus oculatus]|nr:PREDICTED: G-protein coupled receptor 4-like [Lepisosteus oculatus]